MIKTASTITITFDPVRITGLFTRTLAESNSSIWERLRARIISNAIDGRVTDTLIEIPWTETLGIVREFGNKSTQSSLNFRFRPEGVAAEKIKNFAKEIRQASSSKISFDQALSEEEIQAKLIEQGFTKRKLKPFQIRDIQHLLSLPHGANFSVPGAGKTTVTFALHLLSKQTNQHLFIVCPKSAFTAWRDIVGECMDEDIDNYEAEQFILLDGKEEETSRLLSSGATRFIMSYDLMIRQQSTLASYMARQPVHLVLDEAHRMKAGLASQRGAFLISIASLPVRRDILTGTPMPQAASDLISQLSFLWPGHGFDLQIQRGTTPRNVLGKLYVRTTKQELGLPPVYRHFHDVEMSPGQKALYSVVRSEALRQFTQTLSKGRSTPDFLAARKSVMRLLQLSANPTLALQGMIGDDVGLGSGIVDTVLEEGPSQKMRQVADHARELSKSGQKTVIWTIFTNSINELETMLIDLNPVFIYGAVPSGSDTDATTREGKLKRFHNDDACRILIANPAAAGEGISLHTICHNAIYLDRSYVSTHYLQSIDRIHRLGLAQDMETNIHIYRTIAPATLGSVDLSVSRRLATKIRNMQQLLDDPDLHQLALDEEEADDPIDYDIELQDLVDLVEELEGRTSTECEEKE